MRITNCKVNHLTNPVGFALPTTSFSWTVEGAEGKKQISARLIVSIEGGFTIDTGWEKMDSLASTLKIVLAPRTRYTWRVLVRTDVGEVIESEENFFESGKLTEPWVGKWIGSGEDEPRHPVFSKEIAPKMPVARARLYICGLGLYEARWNGERIGGEHLAPYCNDYNTWVQYQTYDVTRELQSAGTLSVELGNGWYNGRFGFNDRTGRPYYGDGKKLIAELRLTYEDGAEDVFGTDETWRVTRSAITFSNIYDGEHRDDTLPPLPAESARSVDAPKGQLTERMSLPVTVQEELPAREVIRTPAGETVLDIGQELTGSFRLKCRAEKGAAVHLQFGEILQNGNFYRDNLRTAKAEYIYVSDGEEHVLEPKFTFFGYRYVKIEGLPDVKAEDFTALVLHSDIPKTGTLTTGSELVNQLISNVEWGQRGNFLDVPTDCPQRDERMGWTGDAQVFAPTACYQRDSYAFFAKYLRDMAGEQKNNGGAVPHVIPSFGNLDCSAAWGDAACIIPRTLYEFYGDRAILDAQFDSMRAWVDFIAATDGIDHGWRRHFHFGDWLALDAADPDNPNDRQGGTEIGFVADVQYLRSARIVAETAKILEKPDDEAKYSALAERILAGIREEFFTPTGRCAVPTQTGLLLTVAYGLSTDADRAERDLAALIRKHGGKLRTGFVGTPLLCPTLTAAGAEDMAFALLLNEDYPGWLYEVKLGATTIWERWNSVLADGSISDTGMNSLNHYAYGSIAEWLYADVAGLRPASPGFRRAILRPHVNSALGHAGLSYDSAAGTWKCGWEVTESGDIRYCCTVPFGCTAELMLPFGGGSFELEPGEFEKVYTPDRPLRGEFSTHTPLSLLLENAKTRALLVKMMPQITSLPAQMAAMSMRELAPRMGGRLTKETLDKIDAALAKI